jgi:hypothetical protein
MATEASWLWVDSVCDYVCVRRYNNGLPVWASHADTEKALHIKGTYPLKHAEPTKPSRVWVDLPRARL